MEAFFAFVLVVAIVGGVIYFRQHKSKGSGSGGHSGGTGEQHHK